MLFNIDDSTKLFSEGHEVMDTEWWRLKKFN